VTDETRDNAASFTAFHRDAMAKELVTRELLANYFGNVQWSNVRFHGWGMEQVARTFNPAR